MKTLMKIKRVKGFTLIELLVVVSIIAMLAVGAFPVFTKIQLGMKAKAAMRNASQIVTGLIAVAQDSEQVFPSKTVDGGDLTSSNDAFRHLFMKGLADDEKIFYVQSSPWHDNTTPDGAIGTAADGFSKALEAKENHWGYVKGLTVDRDQSDLPLVMDGGTAGKAGVWTANKREKGGAWNGKYAIVVRISGSAKTHDLDSTSFTVKDKREGQMVDIFSTEYGTNPDDALNPAG